jgi:hypothetical protein
MVPEMSNEPNAADDFWLTLTDRQRELVMWQLVLDMGGEVSTIPADDVPGRRLLFFRDHDPKYVGMCATEGDDDD